jgi:hypothetical protein
MRILAALPLFLLTACATSPVVGQPTGSVCRSESLSQFIGRQATRELGHEMMLASRARIIRWVPLGGVVTMDFSPVRLTVQLDGANRVQSANCG